MPCLVTLKLYNFRAFERLVWQPSPKINFICGDNGAGKTSLLEGIYYLSRNRSFRATSARELINHDADGDANINASFRGDTIKGDVNGSAPGGNKGDNEGGNKRGNTGDNTGEDTGNVRITTSGTKLTEFNGSAQEATSLLARRLPLVLAAPHNVNLIEADPRHRRAFLDAVLLHLKPNYGQLYRDYGRCLKQRNRLLADLAKGLGNVDQLEEWDNQLVTYGEEIEAVRQEMMPRIIQPINQVIGDWQLQTTNIGYARGWDESSSLTQALKDNFNNDLRYGYTTKGCHRADFSFTVANKPASRVLSLGQQKMLSLAFFCAAALVLRGEDGNTKPLFLLDDVVGQLDDNNCNLLLEYLNNSENQAFITSTSDKNLLKWNEQQGTSFWLVRQGKLASC